MKKTKRILAVMLCLCMAMSILPVGAAATGADSVSVDFSSKVTADFTVSKSGYVAIKPGTGYTGITSYTDVWFAYDLGSLQAGYYDGSISFVPYSSCCEYKFFIVPKGDATSVAEAIKTAIPVAIADGFENAYANASNTKYSPVGAYLPEEGEYYLVGTYSDGIYTTNQYGDSTYFLLSGLNMNKVADVQDCSDKASIDFTDGNITSLKSGSADNLYNVNDTVGTTDVDERQIYFKLYSGNYQFHAFDIGNIVDGDYKGTIKYAKVVDEKYPGGIFDIYLIPVSAANPEKEANEIIYSLNPDLKQAKWRDADAVKIATIDFSDNGGSGYWQNCNFTANDLKAGKYYLVVTQAASDGKFVRLQGFEMVPADFEYATAGAKADANGKALFGDNYAYIRKDGDAWVVNFFGGIKETQGYTEVGFEVNGVEYGSEQVYSKLNVGGQDINNADFGAGVGYIFSEEVALASAPDEIEFRAYAIAADGETRVYGNTYTAVIE